MSINVPIEIGDTILVGKFKNKKIVVKEFGTDKNGQPTVNGKPLLNFRIAKLMNKKAEGSFKMKRSDLHTIAGVLVEAGRSDLAEEITGAKDKKWIQKAIKKPGALHKQLGVPEDKKIPLKKLKQAEKKGGKLGKRARLAETLKKISKKKK